jgi:RecA-family ATPase
VSIEWALYYAETRGWTVFPAPAGSKKSHKSAEYSDGVRWGATKNADQIRDNFTRWSDAGIGIPTGFENGFWVIETDTKNGKDGEGELAKLQAQHGALPDTYRVRSPSGSIHYYFRHPGPDFYITSVSDKVAPGVDVKADGGMVLAPPTLRNGKRYEIFDDAPIAEAPQWLLDIVCRKITDQEKRIVKHAPPTDEPTVAQWEIVKLERWVREALSKNPDWFAERENALKAVWGMKRAGYGHEGYRIAGIICEAFPETQHVARVNRFWNDRSAGEGTATLDTFWQMCRDIGIRDTPEERAHWRDAEKARMFDEVPAKVNGTWIPPEQAPPLASDLPPPPPFQPSVEVDEADKWNVLRSRRINAASLAGKVPPDREWLIRDLIPAKNVTLLYGDGGTGKSLLALQAAAAVVLGTSFFGRLVKKGSVEFVTAEDTLDEMHRRLNDIARNLSVEMGTLNGLHLTSLTEADALLAVPQDNRGGALVGTDLYSELSVLLAESSPAVLFLDTLADIYGGNEVVRAQARQFIGMLRRLALQHGCTVVVLAHPSLAGMEGGTSGSTAWNNSVRSRLYLNRVRENDGSEIDEDLRTLRVQKSNYGRVGDETQLRWRDGVFVSVHQGSGDPLVASARADRVFLSLLTKYADQGQSVGPSPGANYAPKVFESDARPHGVNKRALIAAMQRLLDAKRIWIKIEGPRSRPTRQLVVSTDNSTHSNAPSNPSNAPSNGLQTPSHTPPYNPQAFERA